MQKWLRRLEQMAKDKHFKLVKVTWSPEYPDNIEHGWNILLSHQVDHKLILAALCGITRTNIKEAFDLLKPYEVRPGFSEYENRVLYQFISSTDQSVIFQDSWISLPRNEQ